MIHIQRVYEAVRDSGSPGKQFLVDRLWPRGVRKEALAQVAWLKEVAPSNELRGWYHHVPEKWDDFCRRYFHELESRPEAWQPLVEAAQTGDITLLFSARDPERNNAAALRIFLQAKLEGKNP